MTKEKDNEKENENDINKSGGKSKKMPAEIRKKEYEIREYTVDSKNINEFEILANRRQICGPHVKSMHQAIIDGKNPIGVLIVNIRNGKMRLIDGNHRIESVKRFFNHRESHKDIKIECVLKVYKDLTDEEEREVYSLEAKRRNESYEDRLTMYKDSITFLKLLNDPLNIFPCKVAIYQARESLKFRTVLSAFATMKDNQDGGKYSPVYLGKEEIVSFAQSLNYEDFVLFKEFMKFFIEIYGKVGEENIFTRSQFFMPLFDIYSKNREHIESPNFNERFRRIIGKPDLMNYYNMGGREAQISVRRVMIDHMNYRVSKNVFV